MAYFPFHTFVMDCETTGLDPERHQMLTLGGVLLDGDLVEVDAIELFIRHEEYVVQVEAMAVNKIDLAMHIGISPQSALRVLTDFFGTDLRQIVLAGWNVSFDYSFLWNLAQKYEPAWRSPFVTRPGGGVAGARMLDIYSLAVACTRGIKPHSNVAHTALADARAEAGILRALMTHIDIPF